MVVKFYAILTVERDHSKDSKRRSRLGGGMAYSTNAIHALSAANEGAGDAGLESNHLKGNENNALYRFR